MRKRPTRTDLLGVIGRLQNLVGRASAANNDRNPNRHAEVEGYLRAAHQLCIDAAAYDPPETGIRSPWHAMPELGRMV